MRSRLRRWLPYILPAGVGVGAAALSTILWWVWREGRSGSARVTDGANVQSSQALVVYSEPPVPAMRDNTIGTESVPAARSRPLRLRGSKWIAAALVALAAAVGGMWVYREHRIERQVDMAVGGVADRAVPIILANGCGGCHTISGVPGAQGQVGPRLDSALSSRLYLAGVVTNNKQNMIRWLRASRDMAPHTAMPSTGISGQEARDVAAYLYALR
jgi:cytochrome c2